MKHKFWLLLRKKKTGVLLVSMVLGNARVEPHMCHCNDYKRKINGRVYVQTWFKFSVLKKTLSMTSIIEEKW